MSSRNPTGDINKTYLSNTILSVESHNRREQENDCWRQNKLLKKVRNNDITTTSTGDRRRISAEKRSFSDIISEVDNDERAIWAEKKARLMSGVDTVHSSAVDFSSQNNFIENDGKSVEIEKKQKKEKKAKAVKKKEKKEKKDKKKKDKKEKKMMKDKKSDG